LFEYAYRLVFLIALNYKSSNCEIGGFQIVVVVVVVVVVVLLFFRFEDFRLTTRKTNILKVGMNICST